MEEVQVLVRVSNQPFQRLVLRRKKVKPGQVCRPHKSRAVRKRVNPGDGSERDFEKEVEEVYSEEAENYKSCEVVRNDTADYRQRFGLIC